MPAPLPPREVAYRTHAVGHLADDEHEFDKDAAVSIGEDADGESGAWVACWVWVDREALDNDVRGEAA